MIIPCYNAEKWIERAIRSLLSQEYLNLTIIIVDDGSDDQTAQKVQCFCMPSLYLIQQPNSGAQRARNRGLDAATSEFIKFMDADDYIEGSMIKGQVLALKETKCDLALSGSRLDWPDGRKVKKAPHHEAIDRLTLITEVLGAGWYPCHALMWRRKFLMQIGGWNETIARNQDGELLLRALFQGANFTVAKAGVAVYSQNTSPRQISTTITLESLSSNFSILRYCLECTRNYERRPVGLVQQIGRSAYELARAAFVNGHPRLGRCSLTLARNCGFRGHTGTFSHALLCRAIGLETKSVVERLLANAKAKMKKEW